MTYDSPPLGHIKLARKAFDADRGDPFWLEARTFSRWEAWVDVIQLAAFKPSRFPTTHYGTLELQRGEFVASRRFLAKRWGWTEKRVRVWLAAVLDGARIRAQRETEAGTVYLIVNYDAYQSTPDAEGPAKGPPEGQARAQQGPKIEAVKSITTTTSRPATQSWVARLAMVWADRVGHVSPGYLGKVLKSECEKHGAERLERAMLAYIAVRKNEGRQALRLGWFAAEATLWVERTAAPIAVIDGEMSPTLELLTRPERMAS